MGNYSKRRGKPQRVTPSDPLAASDKFSYLGRSLGDACNRMKGLQAHWIAKAGGAGTISGDAKYPITGLLLGHIILRPLVAELLLKAVLILDKGCYYKTHDLVFLWNQLSKGVQSEVVAAAPDVKKCLANHRNDFEAWRYLESEESNNYEELDPVIGALDAIWISLVKPLRSKGE